MNICVNLREERLSKQHHHSDSAVLQLRGHHIVQTVHIYLQKKKMYYLKFRGNGNEQMYVDLILCTQKNKTLGTKSLLI